jgi:hypothetical protein
MYCRNYVGCAWDQLDSRTLPERYVTDDMTVETCTTYCGSKGYTYAGLQYGQECWCGNSVAPDRLGAHKCRTICAGEFTAPPACPHFNRVLGNDAEYCGDALKLSLYKTTSSGNSLKGGDPTGHCRPGVKNSHTANCPDITREVTVEHCRPGVKKSHTGKCLDATIDLCRPGMKSQKGRCLYPAIEAREEAKRIRCPHGNHLGRDGTYYHPN